MIYFRNNISFGNNICQDGQRIIVKEHAIWFKDEPFAFAGQKQHKYLKNLLEYQSNNEHTIDIVVFQETAGNWVSYIDGVGYRDLASRGSKISKQALINKAILMMKMGNSSKTFKRKEWWQ